MRDGGVRSASAKLFQQVLTRTDHYMTNTVVNVV